MVNRDSIVNACCWYSFSRERLLDPYALNDYCVMAWRSRCLLSSWASSMACLANVRLEATCSSASRFSISMIRTCALFQTVLRWADAEAESRKESIFEMLLVKSSNCSCSSSMSSALSNLAFLNNCVRAVTSSPRWRIRCRSLSLLRRQSCWSFSTWFSAPTKGSGRGYCSWVDWGNIGILPETWWWWCCVDKRVRDPGVDSSSIELPS